MKLRALLLLLPLTAARPGTTTSPTAGRPLAGGLPRIAA